MASPLKQKVDLVSVDVEIGGTLIAGKYELIEVQVKKEVDRIPTATIILLDGNPADVNFEKSEEGAFKPGMDVKISAGYHRENEVIFEGILLSHNTKVKIDDMPELVIKAVDKASKMTTERKNRNFPNAKDSDIITKILGEYPVTADVESTSYEHEGLVQFSSTDWDFIQTRSDVLGYVVTVDDAKVTVGKPKVSEGPLLTLTYGTDITKMDLELDAKGQLEKVEAEGWDMATNKIINVVAAEPAEPDQGNVKGTDISDVIGGGTLQLKSSGPIDRVMLQSWADSKLQRSRLSRIRGKIVCQGHAAPKPNAVVELKGLGEKFNGNAYVTGVYHRIKEFDWDTEITIGLSPQNFAESQKDIQQPPAGGMLPGVHGLQIGTVQKIDEDPQGETRILVDIPVITESGDGIWARQSAYYATKEAGNFWQPEIGDEVILGFLNDDPRYPVILGSVYSKTNMPAYTPDGPNTYKAIVTNSKMKIEFEDIKRIMTLETPNGNVMIYNDDEGFVSIEDENKNKITMDDKGITIYTPKDLNITADGLISMEAMKTIDIKATQDLTGEGLNVTTKASAANTMKGATAEVNGSATTTIKGGVVMIN